MNTVSQTLFAAWLAENQPELFNKLAQRAGAQTGQPMKLSGFTDILSSLGSGISSAAKSLASGLSNTVKSVGSFLGTAEGQGTLTALAGAYGASQTGALATQVARAQAGQAPAPIQMVWDAARQQYVPVNAATGQAIGEGQLNQLRPSFMDQYGVWIAGGLGALLLLTQFMRRR